MTGAPPPRAPLLLEARRIRVVRGGRELLRGVDLHLASGDVLGVLGPSGAGKSTLFRALTGEEAADGGEVFLRGEQVTRWPLWKRSRAGIGYIPQSPSVLLDLTVRQNLETFAHVLRGRTTTAMPSVEEAAAKVGLTERLPVNAGKLSAGERRRLEFARATTGPLEVLVCDEPFAGVDPKGAERLGELLRALAAGGVAVVLADHHVEEALRICTRAMLLLDGAVEVEGSPESFLADPLVRGRYLGTLEAPSALP